MNRLITLCIIIALLPNMALAIKHIPSDTTIGTWDPINETYTLTTDVVNEGLQIDEDGLTLDGAGHWVIGPDPATYNGVYLYQRTGVTIKNLNVKEFPTGIRVDNSNLNNLTDNTVSKTTSFGILLIGSSNNTLTGNTSFENERGIYVQNSTSNTIYNNNFIDNVTQAEVVGGSGNVFNLDLPGGNYWSDYTGQDTNGDGIGDTEIPYTFIGGQDELPWVIENGWSPELLIQRLIEKVKDLNLHNGINNSLDAKLDNALDALEAKNAGQRQDAINKMQAFINAVEAQSGDKIPVEAADDLVVDANYIIYLL